MTSYFAIGGTAAQSATACHSLEAWHALLDAMASGDHDAVLRIAIGERPHMVPTASLQTFPRADEADDPMPDYVREFWEKYHTKHQKTKPPQRNGDTEISVSPNKAQPKTNQLLEEVAKRMRAS